jgi:hypothetical protein
MKNIKNKTILAMFGISLLSLTACEDLWDDSVEGNGNRGIEHRTLQTFNSIEVNGDFEVQIDIGSIPEAVVEADENLLDLIVTHVSGGKLIIEERDGVNLKPSHTIEITVTTPSINEISLNGSGLIYNYGLEAEELYINLAGSGRIECDNLVATSAEFELEGSGSINCGVSSENLKSKLEGSGEIKLSGDCINADHKIIGSGKIKASQVVSDVCVVYISGSGIADTHVNEALDVTIIGSGIVYYTGDPTIDSYISGSGKIIER